jgi:hypothetical protein
MLETPIELKSLKITDLHLIMLHQLLIIVNLSLLPHVKLDQLINHVNFQTSSLIQKEIRVYKYQSTTMF